MEHLLHHIENRTVKNLPKLEDISVVAIDKNILGIALKQDILFVNIKALFSFRAKIENAVNPKNKFRLLHHPKWIIDKEFLEEYFIENGDNPFAINFILTLLANLQPVNRNTIKTQFPPLKNQASKQERLKRFDRLKKAAKAYDLLFMFDRTSKVSRIIRNVDISQWSHVAAMYNSNIIQDMTTSGLHRFNISELDPITYDFALYRNLAITNESEILNKMMNKMNKMYSSNYKYNWAGTFKAYLFRRYRIFKFLKSNHPTKDTTLSDIINSNKFTLIDYV